MSTRLIPTYTQEWPGRRIRDYSERSILALEALGSVVVRRDASGWIKSARWLPVVQRLPAACRVTGFSRVKHTHLEQVGHKRILQHKRLPYAALSDSLTPAAKEAVMRASYQGVQLSVMGSGCWDKFS